MGTPVPTPNPIPNPAATGTPPGSPPKTGLAAFFSTSQGIVAALGALVAGICAIFTTINALQLEWVKKDVSQLDLRERTQKISSAYVDLFIKEFMSTPRLKADEKSIQALLSILDIMAQASGDDQGRSEAQSRKMMPINLALILGESGCVAALDPNYEHLNEWVGTAMSDNHPRTLLTAIKALHGICLRALREEKLAVVEDCLASIEQLIANIPSSSDFAKPYRIDALATRTQLAQCLASQEAFLRKIEQSSGGRYGRYVGIGRDVASVRAIRQYALNNKQSDIATVVENKGKLEEQKAALESAPRPDLLQLKAVTNALASADAALNTAAQNSVALVLQPDTSEPQASLPSMEKQEELVLKRARSLIPQLDNKDDAVRRKTAIEISLLGQAAVPAIIEKIDEFNRSSARVPENALFTRHGLALSLQFMRQPIKLSAAQVDSVVTLLDREAVVRRATGEFFMNLWDPNTIHAVYRGLVKRMTPCLGLTARPVNQTPEQWKQMEVQASSSALIVGTWARNLNVSIPSPNVEPMRVLCRTQSGEWRRILGQSPLARDWKEVTKLLDELIAMADVAEAKAKLAADTAPAALAAATASASVAIPPTPPVTTTQSPATLPAPNP